MERRSSVVEKNISVALFFCVALVGLGPSGEVLFIFSKHVGIGDSNEVEVLAILEAL